MARSVISPESSSLPSLAEMLPHDGELLELCVVRHRIGQSRDREQLLRGIEEIVAAVVGSEEYAVFERDPACGELQVTSSVGLDATRLERPALHRRIVGLLERGEVWIADDAAVAAANEALPLTACIPLRHGDAITGAIAIFRLLPQKKNYVHADREIFRYLSMYAGAAMQATAGH